MSVGTVGLMSRGFVYFLRNPKNKRIYIGCTDDIDRRFYQHQRGNVKATRLLRPLQLEFYQEFDCLETARKIEAKLKRLKRKDYIEKIIKDRVIKMGR